MSAHQGSAQIGFPDQMKKWLKRHEKAVINVGSALAGTILGTMVHVVLDTNLKLAGVTIAILAVAVIGLLSSLSAIIDRMVNAEGSIKASNDIVAKALSALRERVGLTVTVTQQLVTEMEATKTDKDLLLLEFFRSAKEEVHVLDILFADRFWVSDTISGEKVQTIHDGFMQHVRDSPTSITYRRTIQVDDLNNALHTMASARLRKHCLDMLDLKDEGHRVSVKLAKRRYPLKLILVDRKKVAIEMHHQYGEGGLAVGVWGYVFFESVDDNFIELFRRMIEEVEAGMTRGVTRAALREPGDAQA